MNYFEKDILDAHNSHRANHQAPPLIWNSRLASDAQGWAEKLARESQLKHASTEDGENIYMAFGKDVDGDEVVQQWYDEVKNYSFGRPGFQSNTGHFTQVVWKGSRELGVGKAVGHDGKIFVVVRYRPPGNNLRAFEENISPYKSNSSSTWNAGRWDRVNYNDRETATKLDPYKRHSGRWDYNTESMRSRQEPNKRHSDGWLALNISDDRSWIHEEAQKKSSDWSEPARRMSNKREPVKLKDDQSWISKKGANTTSSWSELGKRMSNGYDYITSAMVNVQEEPSSRMSGQTESRKHISDGWSTGGTTNNRGTPNKVTPARGSAVMSEPSKRYAGVWDHVDVSDRHLNPEQEETKKNPGRWDPITDYNKAFPPTNWDSGNWFEPVDDSTASVTYQAAPAKTFEVWDDNDRQETQLKDKSTKRHSGRWQPGMNDVMLKEPQQKRIYSTSKEPWKKQEKAGTKTKSLAERWEKSGQDRGITDSKPFGRNDSTEVDGIRYYGIQAGRGKTRESIRRWEQNSLDQPKPSDQSNQARRSNDQSKRSNRPSQSNQSYPISQSNRFSWPNQSDQFTERWDPLWVEDKPYSQKQRPASIEGTKIFEDKVQNVQASEYQSTPYGEPRERKITTTIVDGPKKTVVSSLTITLKGNENRIKSKSSEDLRPKSSYSRGSRAFEREAYTRNPYNEGRDSRMDSRSKSSEDLRSRGTYPKSTRTPIKEDIVVAEKAKPDQRQLNFDTTDGYRSIKPVSKFPSLGHFAQQALDTHNVCRALHRVPNLMWSPEIADSAQAWAEKLARDRSLRHTTRERGGNDENVAILTGSSENTAKEAIDTWYSEIKNYDFNRPGYHPKAGHFTQLVWKGSKEFGMGCATTPDGNSVVVVARYRPGGNVPRQYELNVFPNVEIFDF